MRNGQWGGHWFCSSHHPSMSTNGDETCGALQINELVRNLARFAAVPSVGEL